MRIFLNFFFPRDFPGKVLSLEKIEPKSMNFAKICLFDMISFDRKSPATDPYVYGADFLLVTCGNFIQLHHIIYLYLACFFPCKISPNPTSL